MRHEIKIHSINEFEKDSQNQKKIKETQRIKNY